MAGSKSWRSPDLPAHFERFLSERAASAGRLAVALSGGRDSVVLLHLAVGMQLGQRLLALHVHHGISRHADQWADHCRELCDQWGVQLQIHRVHVEREAGFGLEAAARKARYAIFATSGADALLLAHHRQDQAETVLFNLIRGSGTTGAAAMPRERLLGGVRLLRPLLDVPPARIVDYARDNGLRWIEDDSNDDRAYARNFLRHEILPRLSQRFPAAVNGLAAAADRFGEAEQLLGELAAIDWATCSDGEALRVHEARRLSHVRLKNLLRWRLRMLGWRAPESARLDEFARQLSSAAPDRHPSLSLPDGTMRVEGRRLKWLRLENGDSGGNAA